MPQTLGLHRASVLAGRLGSLAKLDNLVGAVGRVVSDLHESTAFWDGCSCP